MDICGIINKLNMTLPDVPKPGGLYVPTVQFSGNLLYVSGITPRVKGEVLHPGKVGAEVSLEQAQQDAQQCILNMLSVLNHVLGDLDRIKKIVKILGFVASSSDFYEQPKVMDSASQLLIDVFGEEVGKAARSAVGAVSLPGNVSVEIEALIELNNTCYVVTFVKH